MADKRIPLAEIRRAWRDLTITTHQASAMVGLSRSNHWRRAKALGETARPKGRKPAITDEALFARMWLAGVTAAEIARHFGCHVLTPCTTARRLGLPKRRAGGAQRGLKLAEFAEEELSRRMAEAAKAEQTAFAAEELLDRVRGAAR